jgi:hypothetical protein
MHYASVAMRINSDIRTSIQIPIPMISVTYTTHLYIPNQNIAFEVPNLIEPMIRDTPTHKKTDRQMYRHTTNIIGLPTTTSRGRCQPFEDHHPWWMDE